MMDIFYTSWERFALTLTEHCPPFKRTQKSHQHTWVDVSAPLGFIGKIKSTTKECDLQGQRRWKQPQSQHENTNKVQPRASTGLLVDFLGGEYRRSLCLAWDETGKGNFRGDINEIKNKSKLPLSDQ